MKNVNDMMEDSQRLEDEVGDDTEAYESDDDLDDLLNDEDDDDDDDYDILDRSVFDYCPCGEPLNKRGECNICDDEYMDDFERDYDDEEDEY